MHVPRRLQVRMIAVIALGAIAGCARAPQPIRYGGEDCDVCHMTISDPRFGAELVTNKGKVHKFDSIECMASYYLQARAAGDVRSVWVSDFQHPGTFIPAESAQYLRGTTSAHSPMGKGLAAIAPSANLARAAQDLAGQPTPWSEVLTLAAVSGPAPDTVAVTTPAARSDAGGDSSTARMPLPVHTIVVSTHGAVATLTAAIAQAHDGDRILVRAGVYREPTIVVNKRLEIDGDGDAVLDGESKRQIMTVSADDVTIRHLHLRNVGISYTEDLAAVKVLKVRKCVIADNTIENAFFGVYLSASVGCQVLRNDIRGQPRQEGNSGNGIHLWSASDALIADNHVTGQRDGIYFEFVKNTDVRDNVSERNLRYGLHFMYSDDCRYFHNIFRRNLAGVAVMFTHRVTMVGNRFEDSWGSGSYGLLLKEIFDSRIEDNHFVGNAVGLMADDANRLVAVRNEFRDNGWAIKLLSNTDDARFEQNDFLDNTFDVSMSSGQTTTRFVGNYWDDYRGYDLDHDGFGDVPFRPVRLFSVIVSQNPPTLVLLRSVFVDMLDVAERVLPSLTPETVVDARPAMRPHV
ncbi:MAG: nitrous oxide reductase family maturation protein NosD [Gemmatimonadaceae bacterium]